MSNLNKGDIVQIVDGFQWHGIPIGAEVEILSAKYFLGHLLYVYVYFLGKEVFVAGKHITKETQNN